MYLVWGLFLMSLFNQVWMQVIIIILFSLRLIKSTKKYYWWLVCAVFMFVNIQGLPYLNQDFVVESVSTYRTSLRSGLSTAEVIGEHDFRLGEVVRVSGKLSLDSVNGYQKIRHYQGYVTTDYAHRIKTNTLRSFFWQRISSYEYVLKYFLHDSNTLFSYLSLQLSGFLWLIELIYAYFISDKGVNLLKFIIIVLYGFFFGWVFAVVRILLQLLLKERKQQILFLLLIYPTCATYPGFYLVYGPFMMKHLHYKFSNLHEHQVRLFMLWHLLGRINVLEVLLYPIIKAIAGVISLLVFLHLTPISEYLLSILHNLQFNRLLVVGAPPLIFVLLFLVFEKKKLLISLCLLTISLTYFPLMRVTMINVFQGDAFLIQYPFNAYTILIDTGKANAYNSLKKSLYKLGVSSIDTLVITHDDHDHSGSMDNIIKDFNVGRVVRDKESSVLGMVNMNKREYASDNDNSLVYYMNVLNTSFMFMGDVGSVVEWDIAKDNPHLRVDILKLAHHGSKTSTSDVFLKTLRPSLGLISSDPKSYRHPSKEVMALLHKHRISSVQTSMEGDVSIYLLPFINFVVSEHGGFGIMKKKGD